MGDYPCPICGSSKCTADILPGRFYCYVVCREIDREFCIHSDILKLTDGKKKAQLLNIVLEWILQRPYKIINTEKRTWNFFFDENHQTTDQDEPEFVNLAEHTKSYPSNVAEQVNRALLNLSYIFPDIGLAFSSFLFPLWLNRALYCSTTDQENESKQILSYLCDLGLLFLDSQIYSYKITYAGWVQINEMRKQKGSENQGFIAMSYSSEAKLILETFRTAIRACDYDASVIGEKEHNHQIVPEMFFEIERSKFMVVDVTYQNYGAYYEAGYAQALGKEVIVCCNKEIFEDPKKKPHFDIAQKPIIIWTDLDELKEKLIKRIQVTVH